MAFLIDFVACYVTGFVLILRPAMRWPFYLFCGPLCDDLFIDFVARYAMAFLKNVYSAHNAIALLLILRPAIQWPF